MASDDINALYTAAVAGLGVTVLPLWRAQRALEDGMLVRLLAELPLPKTLVRAMYGGTRRPSRLTRAFVDAVAAGLPPALRTT